MLQKEGKTTSVNQKKKKRLMKRALDEGEPGPNEEEFPFLYSSN